MSGLIRFPFLLGAAIAMAMSYNAWPMAADAVQSVLGDIAPNSIELPSYMAGLVVGTLLWQIARVPWVELPLRLRNFLAAQIHVYQFVLIGTACLGVLIYL